MHGRAGGWLQVVTTVERWITKNAVREVQVFVCGLDTNLVYELARHYPASCARLLDLKYATQELRRKLQVRERGDCGGCRVHAHAQARAVAL